MTPRSRHAGDDGFALVFFALTITLIMMFMALTLDIGAGQDERRDDVGAVDSAVLAAAQEVGDLAKQNMAIRIAEHSLDPDSTTTGFGDAVLAWGNCTDSAALAVQAPSTQCVSFNQTRSRVRVKLPTQFIQFFGGAVGFDPVEHSAAAIAERFIVGLGEILPFALNTNTSGNQCLRSDSGGNADPPCTGPDAGNFGEADFWAFGKGSCPGANSSPFNGDDRLQFNVSSGVDHEVRPRGGDSRRTEKAVCQRTISGPTNSVAAGSGLTQQKFGRALMHGFSLGGTAYLGRMAQFLPGWWGAANTLTLNGTILDDNPLHQFLGPNTSSAVPGACKRSLFVDDDGSDGSVQGDGSNFNADGNDQRHALQYLVATYPDIGDRVETLMERCFAHFVAGAWNDGGAATFNPFVPTVPAGNTSSFSVLHPGGESRNSAQTGASGNGCTATGTECDVPIFTRADGVAASGSDAVIDLQLTSRFGYTPQLAGVFPNNTTNVDIVRFRAVFINRVCGSKCAGASGGNAWTYDPSFSVIGDTPTSDDAGNVTGFVFSSNMLPNGLSDEGAPFDIGSNAIIQLIR